MLLAPPLTATRSCYAPKCQHRRKFATQLATRRRITSTTTRGLTTDFFLFEIIIEKLGATKTGMWSLLASSTDLTRQVIDWVDLIGTRTTDCLKKIICVHFWRPSGCKIEKGLKLWDHCGFVKKISSAAIAFYRIRRCLFPCMQMSFAPMTSSLSHSRISFEEECFWPGSQAALWFHCFVFHDSLKPLHKIVQQTRPLSNAHIHLPLNFLNFFNFVCLFFVDSVYKRYFVFPKFLYNYRHSQDWRCCLL